ncbi:MAG: hypothetical protein ACI4HI_14360 [Lachnospiraceae bacterium]
MGQESNENLQTGQNENPQNDSAQNGYGQNGNPQNGYGQNGNPQNGYGPGGNFQNGYNQNGYPQNGYGPNGYPQNGYQPNGYPQNNKQKGNGIGLGVASLVCGILSICCFCIWYLCGALAIASIVTGILQIIRNEKHGMAIGGIICSVAGIIFAVLLIFGMVGMLADENGRKMIEEIMRQSGYNF